MILFLKIPQTTYQRKKISVSEISSEFTLIFMHFEIAHLFNKAVLELNDEKIKGVYT
jgi:hypothetical protein